MQGLQTGTFSLFSYFSIGANSVKLLETNIFPSNLPSSHVKISMPNLTAFSNSLMGRVYAEREESIHKKKKAISRNKGLEFLPAFSNRYQN